MKKLLIISVLVFINCKEPATKQSPQKPNVLLLYADDLRPELASFGAAQIHSPTIDELANKVVAFQNAYCNVPVCGASRASMLTRMLPTKNRFLDYKTFLKRKCQRLLHFHSYLKTMGTLLFQMEKYITI